MRKYIIYIASFIGAALLHTSCYDDKGDYDYHDVNTMEVVIPETKVRMPKETAVEVSITPEISQTLEQNEENLVFQWKLLNPNGTLGSSRLSDYTNYSVGKECKITVEPNESDNIGLMLVVSDKRNGTAWYQTGQVTIIKPLNPCWFVLQEKENKGLLAAIEGTPEGYYVYPDVFQSETNSSFPLDGKPLAVTARKYYSGDPKIVSQMPFPIFGFKIIPGLTLVTEKDAALLTPSTLQVTYQSDKILFEPVQKAEEIEISSYKMDKNGELYMNDGKSYFAYMDGFCVPYSIQNEAGDYLSVSTYGSFGTSLIFFNSITHSFLKGQALGSSSDYMYVSYYNSKPIRDKLTWSDKNPIIARLINSDEDNKNAFNPNEIDPSLQVKAMVTGGNSGNYAYAITAPQGGKELTVFKFSADWMNEDPTCAAKYTVTLPPDVDIETAKFAASYAYTANIIFMTSGNTLYRINLDRGQIVELYKYEADPSAQITCLKFKDAETEEELGMSLGMGINTGDKGVVVELQLTIAGDVSRDENSICIYEDAENPLGKIVDITYNYE